MIICFEIGGKFHCYDIPLVAFPVRNPGTGPGPVNYPQLMSDATLVSSMQEATKQIADAGVRSAIQSGINSAIQALQKRGGSHVSIKNDGAAGGR